ncbi:MAG: hypothetical protein ACRDID_09295 [Ktedonobacterales bacterium]
MRANIWRTWTRARSTRRAPGVALALLACVALTLGACGTTTTNLPSGVYTSAQYHFKVSYPTGWEVNASPQPNAPSPLIVIITRSGTHQPPGSQISSLTIDVLDMSNSGVAQTAAALAKNSALSKVTIGGQPGYSDKPTVETNAGVTLTHSDFYVTHGVYLYQVSTDALSGDGPALQTMAQSFTLLS